MSGALAIGSFSGLTNLSASAVLKTLPHCAYTTARANAARRVFDFSGHVSRTAASAAAMAAAEGDIRAAGALGDAATLRPLLGASISLAMQTLNTSSNYIKITSVLLWGTARCSSAARVLLPTLGDGIDTSVSTVTTTSASLFSGAPVIVTHVCPMAPRRAPPVRLRVAGTPRTAATVKDSEWVTARTALEARAGVDVEEVILSAGGNLFEGLQSNFFALDAAGSLETAPDGAVLAGTVRGLVLAQAAAAGLNVRFAAPKLSEAHTWRGAFICSTSRQVMPVDSLVWDCADVGAGLGGGEVSLPRDAALLQLEALVSAAVDQLSEDVGLGLGLVEGGAGASLGASLGASAHWAAEAAASLKEARSGVESARITSTTSNGASIQLTTLEGAVLEVSLSVDGAKVTGNERAYDTLHSALIAASPKYCATFNNAVADKVSKLLGGGL